MDLRLFLVVQSMVNVLIQILLSYFTCHKLTAGLINGYVNIFFYVFPVFLILL